MFPPNTLSADRINHKLSEHAKWLEDPRTGQRVNLSRADLSGAIFSGANLSRANLSCANLSGADLSGANLSGVDLSGANLSCADLAHANLSRADLRDANLRDANLSDANLSGANLSCADLVRSDLSGANLTNAKFYEYFLTGAIFTETKPMKKLKPLEWETPYGAKTGVYVADGLGIDLLVVSRNNNFYEAYVDGVAQGGYNTLEGAKESCWESWEQMVNQIFES